ncbi:MAG: efflux RND transporter periplasmic adaptor subunit [Phycisphaeraceae bacterium]
MKLSIPSPHWLAGLAVVVFLMGASVVSVGAQDNHDGHDHAAETEHDDEPDEHASHDHEAEAKADEHAGHDHGEEEEGLTVSPAMMKDFGIVVAPVGPGTITRTTSLPGEVVFNADRLAHVTPSVAGVVREVRFSVGDQVAAGDVMAILGSRELAAARSEYLAAQARLELARESLSRDERLLKDRIGTERQVLEARQAFREAEIALNLAEQSLLALGQMDEQLKVLAAAENTALDRFELRAPLGGVVIERHLTLGEIVSDQPDEVPFVVADLSSVWVDLTVHQRELMSVRSGQKVRIEFGHGLPDATGTLAFVSPAVDERTRTANARVVLPNPDGVWRPGVFVTGRIATASSQAKVVVPISAIQDLDGQTAVFVEHDGAFEARPVRIGQRTGDTAEVLSGLKTGERVVVENGFALKAEMNRGALEHAGHAH